jgi:Xaa-Pro dipeptidase
VELDVFKLERTQAALKKLGLDIALFSEFYNVSYLTGYTMFMENGPSPFTRGSAAALVAPNHVTLIMEGGGHVEEAGDWSSAVEGYEGYSFHAPTAPPGSYIDAIGKVIQREAPQRSKIGVEMAYLPAGVFDRLCAIRPDLTWVDLPPAMMLMVRAVKSHDEIEKIRRAGKVLEVGQEAVRKLVQQPGKTEIEVYSQAKAAMEASIGERFALQNALHGGPNSAHVFPGMPTDYVLKPGDLIISDMVPYYQGYWGDSCSAFVVGGASAITDKHREMHQIARDAYMKGFEAVKPGVTGGQLDDLIRGYVRQQGYEYPHHTGHGLGVSNHEEPRIIIGGQTELEPGMVVVFEPGVYVEGFGGVRQERMFVVTETGAELLAHNSFELA